MIREITRFTAAELENLVVETALASLAKQEAGGFGLAGNGRFREGAPVRITASAVLYTLEIVERKITTRRGATEKVNEILSKNFRLVDTVRGIGNVYFYSI